MLVSDDGVNLRYPNLPATSPNQAVREMRSDLSRDFAAIRSRPGDSFDTRPGNYTYGSVTQEIGFPNWLSLFSGHVFEVAEAVGLKEKNGRFGPFDTDIAQEEMRKGFQCRG